MAVEPDTAVARQVEQALDAVRKGDLSKLSPLEKLGPALAPALARYVKDGDENVRREAIALAAAVGGDAALPLLAQGLSDTAGDNAERASSGLYARFEPEKVAANAAAREAILASIASGEPAAATLLLAGYLPHDVAKPLLERFLDRPAADAPVRLESADGPVSARVAGQLALARLGDKNAMAAIGALTEQASVAEWQFLLAAIRDINAPRMLHALKRGLADERETSAGVPSHAGPRRRVCDETANALVERLSLKTSFALTTTQRYTAEQLAEVRRLVDETIPK
jgi:HEAT repeat protein